VEDSSGATPNKGGGEDSHDVKLQFMLSDVNNDGVIDGAEAKMFRKKRLMPPNSRFMSVWDACIFLCLMFTAIVTPFEVAFIQTDLTNPLFWINRVVDLFFLVDIIFTFFIPFRDPDTNVWVTDHKKIAIRYLKGWFWIDLLSILPFDILGVVLDSDSVQTLKALRLIRLLRLIKLLRLLRTSRIMARWAPIVPLRYSITSLIKFGFAMLLTAHWIACLLGIIPTLEGTTWEDLTPAEIANGATPFNWQVAYFESNGLGYDPGSYSIWTVYLGGFYLASMTVTTIGYGDIVAKTDVERGIMLIVMFIGGGFYAFAIGNVFNIISNMDPLTSEFHDTMDDLNDFMQDFGLRRGLRKRVRKYFHFTLYHRRAMKNAEMLSLLPHSLKSVTAYVVNKTWVDQLPFLSPEIIGEERAVLTVLGELFKHRACGSRERIFTAGDAVQSVFVIERGAVLLHTTKSLVEAADEQQDKVSIHLYVQSTVEPFIRQELTSGRCFGHETVYALDHEYKPSYNATTITYVELHYIEKEEFIATIKKFPDTYARFKTLAVRREWTKHKIIPSTNAAVPEEALNVSKLEDEIAKLRSEVENIKREYQEKDAKVQRLIS